MLWFLCTAVAGPLDGEWVYAGGPAQLARVETARTRILEQFNFAIRPIVANHLRHPLTVHDAFRFEPQGSAVKVSLVGDAPQTYTVVTDGGVLSGPEGSVQLRSQPDGYVLDLVGAQQGHITYALHPDGDWMQIETTISSPRMDGTYVWVLTYQRKQPAGETSGL